ncbi:MAG: Carbohydrate binding domain, partial [Paenibacillus sp.]|nr:Carbohydrate binding domain [Paenibacillus sp.]
MMEKRLFRKILTLGIALSLWVGTSLTVAASGNPWYDKYLAFETAGASVNPNTSTSLDSGVLAFQESYMLRSFLSLYQSTQDTDWLDKFVDRADTVKGNASDLYGDGYLGWESKWYSPNLVTNGTFAAAASGDSTLPNGWIRSQSSSSTAYRSGSSGDYKPPAGSCGGDTQGLVLKTNGTSWQKLYQNLGAYEPNKKYNVRFDAKTNGSAAKGRAYVVDSSNGNAILGSIVFDQTAWEFVEFDFTSPSATGHVLQLWLAHNDYTVTNGTAFFDNVAVSAYYPYILHDGIIGTVLAEFIRLVYDDNSNLSSFMSTANSYKSFIENELIPKWEDVNSYVGNTWVNVSSSEGYYREP